MNDELMLKEIIERRRQWCETRYSDFNWLVNHIKNQQEIIEELQERINKVTEQCAVNWINQTLKGEIKEILNSPNGGIYAPTSSTEWRPLEIPQCSFCDSNNPIVWEDVDGKKMCSHCANGKKYF